ncbi:MAG: diguanylate cyclase, partial [Gammaproteobacteria bacterium]|nr:diguanylate cyclase [Gammaproteobacteria bacterium]
MSVVDELPVILLISGSDFLSKSIERLSKDNFSVLTVADADQACEVLTQKNTVSIVLSELGIATDKNALLHRIRSCNQKSAATLPVIVLAGEGDEDRLLDIAFAAGATDYIDLPFSSVELERRIRMHTGKYLRAFENAEHQLEDHLSNATPAGFLQESYFMSRLDQELLFSKQHQLNIGSAMLKIDNMDKVSKMVGKNISKAINNAVAGTIAKQIRGEDVFTYLGNHTFGILYPVTNALSAQVAIKRIMTKIKSASFQFDGKRIPITASAGLFATQPGDSLSPEQMMQKLKSRLKQTEGLGGNKIVNSKAESEQEIVSPEKGLEYIRTGQA